LLYSIAFEKIQFGKQIDHDILKNANSNICAEAEYFLKQS